MRTIKITCKCSCEIKMTLITGMFQSKYASVFGLFFLVLFAFCGPAISKKVSKRGKTSGEMLTMYLRLLVNKFYFTESYDTLS